MPLPSLVNEMLKESLTQQIRCSTLPTYNTKPILKMDCCCKVEAEILYYCHIVAISKLFCWKQVGLSNSNQYWQKLNRFVLPVLFSWLINTASPVFRYQCIWNGIKQAAVILSFSSVLITIVVLVVILEPSQRQRYSSVTVHRFCWRSWKINNDCLIIRLQQMFLQLISFAHAATLCGCLSIMCLYTHAHHTPYWKGAVF